MAPGVGAVAVAGESVPTAGAVGGALADVAAPPQASMPRSIKPPNSQALRRAKLRRIKLVLTGVSREDMLLEVNKIPL